MQDSDDDLDEELQSITSGMGLVGGANGDGVEDSSWSMDELADYLRANPLSLMAQNVAIEVFDSQPCKNEFENIFRKFSENGNPEDISFNYLKSFRRVRVNYPVGFDAICAKVELHQTQICGSFTNVYLTDQSLPNISCPEFLEVPQSDKMFLISPPPSPPVGWESGFEEPPHPAPDIDLSSMNISSSPSTKPSVKELVAKSSALAASGSGEGKGPVPIATTQLPYNNHHPHLDSMILLTAFAHHCSQPGQVVEILPPDEGTPSIMVTSVDGPPAGGGKREHVGPIPRSPCPPYASHGEGDGGEADDRDHFQFEEDDDDQSDDQDDENETHVDGNNTCDASLAGGDNLA